MRLLMLIVALLVSGAAVPAVAEPENPYSKAVREIVGRETYEVASQAYRKRDYVTALRLWHQLAEDGYARAQTSLGMMYQNGEGVPQNDAAAVAWYRKAADQGDKSAQGMLDLLFLMKRTTYQWKWPTTPDSENFATNLRVPAPPAVPMKKDRGMYLVPVLINNAITLDFMVDSGASDVSIPEDVVTTLIRMGAIRDTDFTGERTYVLADGSKVQSKTFRIRSLKVGDHVLENVTGSGASTKGSLLLGQSFLGRFRSWSIDNSRHVLLLE